MNGMEKASQRMQILSYCAEHGSITIREASDVFGMNSASKRISELRKLGYVEDQKWETKINKNGKKKRYLRYYIKKPESVVAQ